MAKDFKSDVEKYGLTVTTTLDLPEQDPTALLRCQENFKNFCDAVRKDTEQTQIE